MAQHDFAIANQSFPATRADINNFLQAVATTHSGTSTPSGAVAGTIWLDTTTATAPILKYYDGTDNITLATIDHVANTVNFSDSALDLLTDTTPQLGGNLDVNGNSIVSTSNANITLAPNGTGDVVLSADTIKIGDANANATITTDGTGDLILNTNSGSSSGSITIADGANGAITIAGNGTGQIIVNAGAVGTPTIAPTGDLNTGIFFPSADTIAFTEGGTEAMRIDSSGRVGIGTTDVNGLLNVVQASNTQALLRLRNNTADTSTADGMIFTITDSSAPVGSIEMVSGGSDAVLAFRTNGSERMRISSVGEVLMGTTSGANPPSQGIANFGNISNSQIGIGHASGTASGQFYVAFGFNAGLIGGITQNGTTAVAYNTTSDYRLKENVNYNFDATTRLKQLKPARFNFITEPNRTVDGFLAHEVQLIIPEAITGTKDQVEAIGNITDVEGKIIRENVTQPNELPENQTWTQTGTRPVHQGIDQAKLTPLLTKALQEAIAKIEQLEARLTALENK